MNNTIPDIVQGHEIWLEYEMQQLIIGKAFECKLLLGHNMAKDGVADAKKVKAAVINSRKKEDLPVDTTDSCLAVKFIPDLETSHIVVVEYDAGIYTVTEDGWFKGPKKDYVNVKRSGHYYQYAKTIISVCGNEKINPVTGQELEIIPAGIGHYHVGDTIELKVLYDGAALVNSALTAAVGGNGGKSIEAAVGADGTAAVFLDQPGNWMFKVRHADPSKGIEYRYDEKVITAVFTIMGVH